MLGLRSNFETAWFAAATVLVLGIVAALVAASRSRKPLQPVSRILTATSAVVILASTLTPRAWPPRWEGVGDLVLRPGDDSLGRWSVLTSDPSSLAAILLIANVVLFVPLGFFGALGWRRPWRAVACALVLSVTIEAAQLLLLGRVAATDDVISNVIGAAGGAGLASLALRHRRFGNSFA